MDSDPPRSARLSDFSDALLDGSVPVPSGVTGPDGKAAPKRFGVYRNNVIVSLIEAIEDTFPAVQTMLGEEYFKALARAFVIDHPPSSPVLIWYGGDFPAFVASFEPLAAYPYLADVARLEWAWLQSYHAEDAPTLDPSDLAAVSAEDLGGLRLEIHPAVCVVASQWPILSLFQANRAGAQDGQQTDLAEPQSVLVTRPSLEVDLMRLRPGSSVFLEALKAGTPLAGAAEASLASVPTFNLSEVLGDFLSAGVFKPLQ